MATMPNPACSANAEAAPKAMDSAPICKRPNGPAPIKSVNDPMARLRISSLAESSMIELCMTPKQTRPNPPMTSNSSDKPKLMEKLKKEMMQTWESISEMMEMSSIEEFANEIKAIGIEHRVSGLQNYAQNLFEFINAFDVIQIENEVKRFPKLVEEIENSEGFKK